MAGHDVHGAGPAPFRAAVEAAGLPFVPAGSAEIPPNLMAELAAVRSNASIRSRLMLTRVMLGLQPQAIVPGLLALIDDWQPVILLRGHLEYGAYIADEVRGLPHASTGAVNFPPPGRYAPMLEGWPSSERPSTCRKQPMAWN